MKTYSYITISLFCLLISCNHEGKIDTQVEDLFHAEIENALIPVKVRGNTLSQQIILFLPGGPGGTGLDVSELDPGNWQDKLEKEVAVAYYDQRGIGNAQGRFSDSTITLNQYLNDIHSIVQVLHHRYPDCKVYLMGHSFGAMLVYRYINTFGEEELVEKYIAASGVGTRISDDDFWFWRRAYVENIALEKIDQQIDTAYWQEALDFLQENPFLDSIDQRAKLFSYMQETQIEGEIKVGLNDIFNILLFSETNFFPYYLSFKERQELLNRLVDEERQWNIKGEIPLIDKPIMLIGGEYDIQVPPQELRWIYKNLASSEKQIHILPDAGHDHYINQPELFQDFVLAFIKP